MKKFLVAALSIMMMLLFTACGPQGKNENQTEQPETTAQTTENPNPENNSAAGTHKILVAYFSRTGDNYEVGNIEKGNTAIVAEMVAEKTGGTLFEIKPVKEYPAGYKECTEVAKQEQAENARPEIATKIENLQEYDTIFLGYPVWWSDFPMLIYTFLEQNDFNGKTIIPFCTSAGEYMTGKEMQIPQIAKGSMIAQGLGIRGKECQENPESVKEKVVYWINGLGY